MGMISQAEFERVCRDVYYSREMIWREYPHLGREDALWWAILRFVSADCCVELPAASRPASEVTANAAACRNSLHQILAERQEEPFEALRIAGRYVREALK